MKQSFSKSNLVTATGLLFAVPAAYFIFISVLKYEFGVNGLYDFLQPSLERMGIQESIGWNVNLLILFGPVLALLLTIFQVLRIKWEITQQQIHFHVTVQKSWFPILVGAFSLGILAILFVYGFVENCNC